ncbi:putative structural protein [Agrobacterium phage OLIVR2]|uniref:Putative structural protein n=1 Tax=Agrobacterium phage OLIVR1 TaxID=2723769 RepID=A0A858MRR5_9CAUD|nr:hypothetical protein [Xanthomonas campestris]YP_010107128.1 putative structural protein [Agrobacterium phage OLIVR1]QIW87396.1 putative structural protein [Agrobacterium phage OLIVR2]QIW87503.1 putative structural protein [Agrobacterium phage OLIVR3]MCF8861594.1 hypothetical protein [Xanthomonas campestris pv. campestris]QIW87289.1 putative structural protein [Agrobacterium phage OLIVR1]
MSKALEIEGLEYQKKKALEEIAFSERVAVLLRNPDFQKIIMQEYIIDAAANFVASSGDPLLTKEQREDALAMAQAPGHLKRWLQITQTKADNLRDRLPEIDEEIEHLRAETEEDGE